MSFDSCSRPRLVGYNLIIVVVDVVLLCIFLYDVVGVWWEIAH